MEEDYAVIIGLQNYPGIDDPASGFPPLSGAENDAKDFKDWVASPDGGAVPEQNIKLILSSDYATPVMGFFDAKPTQIEICWAFDKLRFLSLEKRGKYLGSKVGRRLYIFMSGHGIAPTPLGNKIEKEAALLTANFDSTNPGAIRYHIPGTYTANWFCENDCFDEVFLFMDCCRDIITVFTFNGFLPGTGNSTTATRFFAFGANHGSRAKERVIDNKMQGVFTKTLLMGLNGAGAEPDPNNKNDGLITAASLKSYLYQNMKEYIDPKFIDGSTTPEPDVDYFPKAKDGKDILIKSVPLQKFPVIVNIPIGASGTAKILYNGLNPVHDFQINNAPDQFSFSLPRGSYSIFITINANQEYRIFDVKGIEKIGNEVIINF